jgi:hypothetical protein
MYLPYLRGKQFELIALREIGDVMAARSSKISPVIEPVKDSSTLKSAIADLSFRNINFNVIINPAVGDLVGYTEHIIELLKATLVDYDNYQIGVIIDENWDINYLEVLVKSNLSFKGFTLIHNIVAPNPDEVLTIHSKYFPVVNNIVNFKKTNRRYYRSFKEATVVSLEDFFSSQSRNVDYIKVDDSPFSEEHLFFKKDGIKGFSDFLTIGDIYSETGFLPYAVAIHLSYSDAQNKVRIKHFVSDSNDDTSDVAGKFAEALKKLVTWCDKSALDSVAIREFRELNKTGHFPGLGTVKKLSIMHHIELVLNLV